MDAGDRDCSPRKHECWLKAAETVCAVKVLDVNIGRFGKRDLPHSEVKAGKGQDVMSRRILK